MNLRKECLLVDFDPGESLAIRADVCVREKKAWYSYVL